MDECTRIDFISNLPHDIIEIILTKLPIGDAVRTCVLSTKWRYRWATMTQLVFDDSCVCASNGSTLNEEKLCNFILRCLFLHDGHINKFVISSWYLDINPELDQFLLFLSRKDVKELVLNRRVLEPFLRTPSAIFSCQQLTSLTLRGFEVKTPLTFRGFPFLKYLSLEYDIITREVVENLISGCPLLEKFIFANFEHIALKVHAPNLKHLFLDGNFEHIYLDHAPLLVAIIIEIDTESSEGNNLVTVPVTYHCLKFIELKLVNFKERNEALYVLHLILQSPNLQELQISIEANATRPTDGDDALWSRLDAIVLQWIYMQQQYQWAPRSPQSMPVAPQPRFTGILGPAPRQPQIQSQQAFVAPTTNLPGFFSAMTLQQLDENWYMDFGASFHLMNNPGTLSVSLA
ncbi:F-box/FBD/LRR-repeat protein At1g13570-like [Apium graveolens]|uniref:F-box/FBD/LRR-repeat protein At1g13570-like n=1 Tax=Apium graveolens TaxID=4045 RepID=UPI003D7B13FC